ncbi:hypothetical protein D3C80_1365450 [compost metagenome]
MQKEIQHAFFATRFRQVEVLKLVNQQRADVKRTGHLLHLLQCIINIPVPIALVVVLVTQGLTYRIKELLAEPSQRSIPWTVELEPCDLGLDELLALIAFMPNRLRIETQDGMQSCRLPDTTQADYGKSLSSRLKGVVIALSPR